MVVLGAAIPAHTWLAWLRGSAAELDAQLLLGGGWFRAALVLLGAYLAVGGVSGWLWPPREGRSHRPVPPASAVSLWLLSAILISATAVRLYRLGDGLWLDEIVALVNDVRKPVGEILTTYESQNQHYLYSLLARLSCSLLGESAWSLRLPAAGFGVASLWALYGLGREVSSTREALLSAALAAFSYQHVWFSQNARGYTGLLFWTLFSTWLLMRALKTAEIRLWNWYAVSVAAGVFTHMTMVFVVAAHVLVYLRVFFLRSGMASLWRPPLLGGFGLAVCLTFALHALTLPQIVGPALADLSNVPLWRSPWWTAAELLRGLHVGIPGGMVATLALVGVLAGVAGYFVTEPAVIMLAVLPPAIGSIVMFGMGHPVWPRFYFFAVGFGLLIVVRGAFVCASAFARLRVWPRVQPASMAVVACLGAAVVSAVTVPAAYGPKQDFGGVRDFIESRVGIDDAVVTVGEATFPFSRYYGVRWQPVDSAEGLLRIAASHRRTWVVYTMPVQMEAEHADILQALRDFQFVKEFRGTLNGGSLFVYESRSAVWKSREDPPAAIRPSV